MSKQSEISTSSSLIQRVRADDEMAAAAATSQLESCAAAFEFDEFSTASWNVASSAASIVPFANDASGTGATHETLLKKSFLESWDDDDAAVNAAYKSDFACQLRYVFQCLFCKRHKKCFFNFFLPLHFRR